MQSLLLKSFKLRLNNHLSLYHPIPKRKGALELPLSCIYRLCGTLEAKLGLQVQTLGASAQPFIIYKIHWSTKRQKYEMPASEIRDWSPTCMPVEHMHPPHVFLCGNTRWHKPVPPRSTKACATQQHRVYLQHSATGSTQLHGKHTQQTEHRVLKFRIITTGPSQFQNKEQIPLSPDDIVFL